MKTVLMFLASAVVLTIAAASTPGLTITAGLSSALSRALEATRVNSHTGRNPIGADYVISKIDASIVKAFRTAWIHSGGGTSPHEGVVLILRMADGTYFGKDLGSSNEYKRFTFQWHPATIGIVHTHPNTSDPKPHDEDLNVADKYSVPVFTITRAGMYVYDPTTRRIDRVLGGLDWLDASKFSKTMFARGNANSHPAENR